MSEIQDIPAERIRTLHTCIKLAADEHDITPDKLIKHACHYGARSKITPEEVKEVLGMTVGAIADNLMKIRNKI